MTCCTGLVYGPSPWRASSATCAPPAGRWGSTPPPTTAGSGNWSVTAQRSCGPESGACRGWPIRPACWSSSGWLPSPRPPGVRAGPDRRRIGQIQVGRHPAVDQRGVAGAAPLVLLRTVSKEPGGGLGGDPAVDHQIAARSRGVTKQLGPQIPGGASEEPRPLAVRSVPFLVPGHVSRVDPVLVHHPVHGRCPTAPPTSFDRSATVAAR
jgi:hypothetical protein